MEDERRRDSVAASAAAEGAATGSSAPRWTRRQAIGRMSVVAAAGAAAWVAPEILTATPASGAPLSGATEAAVVSSGKPAPSSSTSVPIVTLAKSLASTGLDLERDAVIGAAMLAGGWAMHHWASRPPAEAASEAAAGPGIPAEAE